MWGEEKCLRLALRAVIIDWNAWYVEHMTCDPLVLGHSVRLSQNRHMNLSLVYRAVTITTSMTTNIYPMCGV